jgi:hypothetical protein
MLTKDSALQRVLRPFEDDLPPDFARRLLALDFSESDHARCRELSEKAQLGLLSEQERVELDDLLTANDLLMILQTKARISLNKRTSAV